MTTLNDVMINPASHHKIKISEEWFSLTCTKIGKNMNNGYKKGKPFKSTRPKQYFPRLSVQTQRDKKATEAYATTIG